MTNFCHLFVTMPVFLLGSSDRKREGAREKERGGGGAREQELRKTRKMKREKAGTEEKEVEEELESSLMIEM